MFGIGQLLRGFGPDTIPTAAPTLAVVNNDDGTATATIAVGDSSADNTVYVQRIDPNFRTQAWASAGTRTGNGTVTLTLASGVYFAQVRTGSGAVSQAVYFVVTDGTKSITDQIADAVVARLQLASLPSIADASIVKREWESPQNLPSEDCVLVCPVKLSMPWQDGTTIHDDVGYDFAVVFLKRVGGVDADTGLQEATLDGTSIDLWGHRIEKAGAAFRQQPLTGVTGVFFCAVEPFKLVTVPHWAAGRWVSGLTLRFKHRESRGLR